MEIEWRGPFTNRFHLIRTNHNYRNLWLASVGSEFGSWFNEVAIANVILNLTHSPSAMGMVLLCRSLPGIILGPCAGPLADQLPQKTVLVATDLVRAVLAVSLSLAVLMHLAWILYVSSGLLGVTGILFAPTRTAVIANVVVDTEVAPANALDVQASGLIQIAGTALGGVVSATLGPIVCFALNATSFLWSAWHISRCHWNEVGRIVRNRLRYLESLREGFVEASRNRVVRAIIIIGISWGLAGGGYYVLIPLLGQQVYHMGGFGIGLLYVIDGMGVLLGAHVVNHYAGQYRRRAV